MSRVPDDTQQNGRQHNRRIDFRKQDTVSFVKRGKEVRMQKIKLVYRYGGRKLKEFTSDGLYFLCDITEGVFCYE